MARIDSDLLHWSNDTVSYVHNNHDNDDDDYDLRDIRRYFRQFTDNRGASNIFVVLLSRNQQEVMTSDLSEWRGLPFKFSELDSLPENEEIYKTLESPGRANKIRVIYEKSSDGFIVETGLLLDDYQAVMDHYRTIFISTALDNAAGRRHVRIYHCTSGPCREWKRGHPRQLHTSVRGDLAPPGVPARSRRA